MDGRTIAATLGLIALPVLLLGGCAAIVVGGFIAWATPDELDGYSVREISCEIDPASGDALVHLTMSQLNYSADQFRVEPLSNQDLGLVGEKWIDVDGTTDVVIQLHSRIGEDTEELKTITLWWAPGEPAFVQDVELNLVWDGSSCSVRGN